MYMTTLTNSFRVNKRNMKCRKLIKNKIRKINLEEQALEDLYQCKLLLRMTMIMRLKLQVLKKLLNMQNLKQRELKKKIKKIIKK